MFSQETHFVHLLILVCLAGKVVAEFVSNTRAGLLQCSTAEEQSSVILSSIPVSHFRDSVKNNYNMISVNVMPNQMQPCMR